MRTLQRIVLFRFHTDFSTCSNHLDILRTLNPGMPIYGLFGGVAQDFPNAKQLPLDHVWAIPLDDPHWKWVNGDLCVRWWYTEVGRHTTFDMLHLVDWDLILLESLERHFASVRDGIAMTGITPMEQVYDTWSWVAPIRGRYEWLKLKAYVEHVYGYHHTPLAGFFCGASFSRQFLARYAQVEVPGWCNDEVRVPLFAQAFGLPVHDTRLGNEFFTAGAEMISPSTVYAQYRQGLRSFHPVRERLTLAEITRVTRVRYVPNQNASDPMADRSSPIQFEDVPLDEARRMGRGPRIDPELYRALQQKLQSLGNTAARMTIPEGTSPTTMKTRILRVAAELGIPVTIRRVPGGLLFWRSTDEDLPQAKHVAQRLQTARRQGRAHPGQRRRGSRRTTFPDDPSSRLHREGRP
jgi:hypothetical protein